MAQKGVQLDVETFSCSICPDLLKDPVAIPCGHSYCMRCIQSFWDEGGKKKSRSCPQCRQTFARRPALVKNTMLAALVEQLKKTGLQTAPADRVYAGPEDVACDVCTGRKQKATRSCLICLASYCEEHLQPHYNAAPLQKHKLVEPSKKLMENFCSHHNEVMNVFCRTDQQCICILCTMDEHKCHETVPVAAERTERQKKLEENRHQIQQKITDQEKNIKRLQQDMEAIIVSADKAVDNTEKIFTELISLIQKRSSDVKQQIRSEQETEVSRVKELQGKLEQEITELKRKDAELEQLSHTEDHNQFLQNYVSLSTFSESADSSSINIGPLRPFEDVTAAVSVLRDKLQDILTHTGTNVSLTVSDVDVLLSSSQSEPKIRAEFLKYAREITLDPNTAYRTLLLSKENRAAIVWYEDKTYTPNPERFTTYRQALSRESLTGRCYFEFKWAGIGLFVAVAYKTISRAGRSNESMFGFNDKSWALRCDLDCLRFTKRRYTFCHNKVETAVSGPRSDRVGVYLDHSAGILSFYDVSETMTLLHRVQTVFTQPLYAGLCFYFCDGGNAEFCNLKETG